MRTAEPARPTLREPGARSYDNSPAMIPATDPNKGVR